MKEFKDVFTSYGGDYEPTMERMMGNQKLYIKFLDQLLADENIGKLEQALQEENLKAAFEAAHALKGVVGNLGLTPLYESTCDIVEPLRRGDLGADYPSLFATIKQNFTNVKKLKDDLSKIRLED